MKTAITPVQKPGGQLLPEKDTTQQILKRHADAKSRRSAWEGLWSESYAYALPQHNEFNGKATPANRGVERIFDATALDAVDQLSASLLAQLTPPWSAWFGLKPGPDLDDKQAQALSTILEKSGRMMLAHFDRSNFAVELHQCFLDLVTGGTAVMLFEEAPPGSFSAFRFTALPLASVTLDENPANGRLETVFRESDMTLAAIRVRYPDAALPPEMTAQAARDEAMKFTVIECIEPNAKGGFTFNAVLSGLTGEPVMLRTARLAASPFIAFRWIKSAGEVYGRSPVMKALPDIRTANKVVELILKNASIAVAGIWQADDDGVLNPANVTLAPGTIIPKAVGSAGLKPLEMPGKFDVSQLVLDDLRKRIRHALLIDRLGAIGERSMTATEVLERSGEVALLLGAIYGRLQSELLTPLIIRAHQLLRARGEIADVVIDGRNVILDYRSPLALAQGTRNVQSTINWITTTLAMGPAASNAIDLAAAARFMGEAMGVPADLIRKDVPIDLPALADAIAPLQQEGASV